MQTRSSDAADEPTPATPVNVGRGIEGEVESEAVVVGSDSEIRLDCVVATCVHCVSVSGQLDDAG